MKIYGLFDKRDPTTIVYVGSTKRRLSTRLKNHLDGRTGAKITSWVKKIGRKNVGIKQLERCQPWERAERESWHMTQFSDLLNTNAPSAHYRDKRA